MENLKTSEGYQIINNWMTADQKVPFEFQERTWNYYHKGYSGMVVAPTGFGKTFSVFFGRCHQLYQSVPKNAVGFKTFVGHPYSIACKRFGARHAGSR